MGWNRFSGCLRRRIDRLGVETYKGLRGVVRPFGVLVAMLGSSLVVLWFRILGWRTLVGMRAARRVLIENCVLTFEMVLPEGQIDGRKKGKSFG
jgi:hypothetical protein